MLSVQELVSKIIDKSSNKDVSLFWFWILSCDFAQRTFPFFLLLAAATRNEINLNYGTEGTVYRKYRELNLL